MLLSIFSLVISYYLISIAELEAGLKISDWLSIFIWATALILLINYEFPFGFRLKEKGLPGNIAISLSIGLVVVFGSSQLSNHSTRKFGHYSLLEFSTAYPER